MSIYECSVCDHAGATTLGKRRAHHHGAASTCGGRRLIVPSLIALRPTAGRGGNSAARARVQPDMRVLFTTTGGAGHVGPLLPFVRALRAAGHEILVTVRRSNAATVVAAGLPVRDVDDAPPEPRAAVFAQVWGLSTDRANALVVGEVFAGLDAPAALPGIQAAIEDWRPEG